MDGNGEVVFKEMTLNEITIQCVMDSETWFPESSGDIGFWLICLFGESGEFANIVKKIMRGSLDANDEVVQRGLAMELTDIFIYLMNIVGEFGWDMNKLYQIKREINVERFGTNTRTD